jgi:4-methyl-5(b-hydroxyethyl)-thiazole monophosphate biosynthesis
MDIGHNITSEEKMRVLVPLAQGFEEIEAITVVDILRRADIEVVMAGLSPGPISGSHNIKVLPDALLDDVLHSEFGAVILPGGAPGFINLGKDERVLKIAREMDKSGKCVAAICAAPSVLIKAGVLKEGRKATVNPAGREEVATCACYVDDRVVVDKNLVTSKSPGTAMEFALKLVEILAGEEKAKMLGQMVIARV